MKKISDKGAIKNSAAAPPSVVRHLCKIVGGAHSPAFEFLLRLLRRREEAEGRDLREVLYAKYEDWSGLFEQLKREFNSVWELFEYIESKTPGWYCISPNEAIWKTVGIGRGGYTFAACIMKNYSRSAPFSEKSLTVSFGFENACQGIGDEKRIGFPGDLSDSLVGLSACTDKNLVEQVREMDLMCRQALACKLWFRIHHATLGQQSTKLDLSILKQHSLTDLCEKLFYAVNNDIIMDFQKELGGVDPKLIAVNGKA